MHMAKVVLKNMARGARGVRGKDGELVMIEAGATSAELDLSDSELKDALATGDFEKASAKEAAAAEEGSTALGEPGPGDPPKPEGEPENEVAAAPRGRRAS
jgi:hypothetical protein